MDIRVLRYFLTLAAEGSISAAAKALYTTQPNLSKQLSELEKEVGQTLFIRGSRKIMLTDAGMLLRKRAQEVVRLLEKTEQDLANFDDLVSGDVYIGNGETPAMKIIARAVHQLQHAYPQIRYHLQSGYAYDGMEGLDKSLLDFGVLIEPIDLTQYDHIRLPITNTLGLLMRKDNPLTSLPAIRPEDMRKTPLLCSKQILDENGLSGWLGYDCHELNIVSTFNLIGTPALLVEEGVGSAISFENLLNLSGDCQLCFRPLEPGLKLDVYLVWKKHQTFSKAAQKFLECLHQVIGEYA